LYRWIHDKTAFDDDAKARIQAYLDGAEPPPLKRRLVNGFDHGEMGIAIVTIPETAIARVLDVAGPMGGLSVFQKRLADNSMLIIYRFTDTAEMLAFKAWAKAKCDVVTP